jgi:hypothetical protein
VYNPDVAGGVSSLDMDIPIRAAGLGRVHLRWTSKVVSDTSQRINRRIVLLADRVSSPLPSCPLSLAPFCTPAVDRLCPTSDLPTHLRRPRSHHLLPPRQPHSDHHDPLAERRIYPYLSGRCRGDQDGAAIRDLEARCPAEKGGSAGRGHACALAKFSIRRERWCRG